MTWLYVIMVLVGTGLGLAAVGALGLGVRWLYKRLTTKRTP